MFFIKVAAAGIIFTSLLTGCSFQEIFPMFGAETTGEPLNDPERTATFLQLRGSETVQPETTHQVQVITVTAVPTLENISEMTESVDPENLPCNLASAGIPLDVTIPDDTRLAPDEKFSKVWRLVNSGSCSWTSGYSVVWFSGDDFETLRTQPILAEVQPGETVDVTVDMVAPAQPGLYSGYWMLKSDSGELFGIGPNGDSAFWVRVQVVAENTSSPTVTSTPAPTTAVLVRGKTDLSIGQSVDLDSGELSLLDKADGMLKQLEDNTLQWTSLNSGRFAVFGMSKPGELECRLATLTEKPINISELQKNVYLCYRTSDGLPGLLQILNLPVGDSPMQIDFTTWAVP